MEEIVEPLLKWYNQNRRMLPWRLDKNPYHVWISEIMLQQTRIEAVKEYYDRFMKDIPSIESLASIPEEKLLKYWEGLGYYNRARNLKKAAEMIMERFEGKFPEDYQDILSLPGIGEYTAGAISSICFDKPEVAVDGNVLRVMMRLMNCDDKIDEIATKKRVKELLLIIVPTNSGDFNQGIMELGEVICLPNTYPKCEECPLKDICKGKKEGTAYLLPQKNEKKQKRQEYHTVLIYKYQDEVAIRQRKEKGLLHNLWEFPNIIGQKTKEEIIEMTDSCDIEEAVSYQHVFTHIIWNINSYKIVVSEKITDYEWTTLENLKNNYALPTAFQPILKYLEKE